MEDSTRCATQCLHKVKKFIPRDIRNAMTHVRPREPTFQESLITVSHIPWRMAKEFVNIWTRIFNGDPALIRLWHKMTNEMFKFWTPVINSALSMTLEYSKFGLNCTSLYVKVCYECIGLAYNKLFNDN